MFDHDAFMFQGADVVGHHGHSRCRIWVEGTDIDVADGNGSDWGLGQADKGTSRVANVMQFDVLDTDFADCWGPVVHLGDCAGLHPVVMTIGIAMVKTIGAERGLDPIHKDIGKPDIGDLSASPAAAFQPQTTVGSDHFTVLDHDAGDFAAHFRSNDNAAVAAFHEAMGDPDVAGGAQVILFAVVAAFACLNRDAIIADRKLNTCDRHIFAHFGIAAIGVRAVMWGLYVQRHDPEPLATLRVNCPRWGATDRKTD